MRLKKVRALAFGVLLGAAGTMAVVSPAAAATTVSGRVMCVSQRAVVGVWIQAESGGSGWANWSRTGVQYEANYSRSLPNGGRYQVHVGCGGTPQSWASNNKSGYVGGTVNYFTCSDVPYAGQYSWRCVKS